MKKIQFLSIFALSALLLSGCANSKLLQEVETLALVSVRYNQQISTVTKAKFNSGKTSELKEEGDGITAGAALSKLNKLTGNKSKLLNTASDAFEAVSGKEKEFFDSMTQKLIERVDASPLSIVPATRFATNTLYLNPSNNKLNNRFNDLKYYTPQPYVYQDLETNKLRAKPDDLEDGKNKSIALTKELNVDAVASFEFQFFKVSSKKLFLIPAKQIGAIGTLVVRNKDGKMIFNKNIKVISDKAINLIDLPVFVIDEKSEKQFKQVEELFFNELDSLITKALTKK
jgi:hypothetical protein